MKLSFTVQSENNGIVLRNYLRLCGLSTSLLRSVKYAGGYFKNGISVHTNEVLHTDDIIEFELPDDDETAKPEDIPLDIIYENNHIMLVNKPAYMAVHPTIGYPSGTLANAFCGEMKKRGENTSFRCIGRLDRNTSGLVMCALNAYSAALLDKNIDKEYIAIVHGCFNDDNGTINAPIGLEEGSYVKHCVRDDGKTSVTHYNVISQNEEYSIVRLKLETGRTHQIRVHMSYIGHPLVGDDFYGGNNEQINRHALHCEVMHFEDIVTNKKMTITAPLPTDMTEFAKKHGLI